MTETDLVYFITLCHESQAYREQLAKDHEPDEIYSQMFCARDMLATRARINMYNDILDSGLRFREFDKYTQSKMLFDAIEYQRQFDVDDDYFNKFAIEYYVNAFIKYYGKPVTISEVILKAIIRNDIELEKILRKYL